MIQLGEHTKTVVIICAFARYNAPDSSKHGRSQLPELKEIEPAVLRLQVLFSSDRYKSAGIEVIPPLQCANSSELKAKLAEIREVVRQRPGTNLVLFWSGHGGLDAGSFRLATPDTLAPIEQEDGLGLDEISRETGIARVTTWTLFLDACHAGAGFEGVVSAVNKQVMGEASKLRGFGSMCSSAPYARARDSVFLNKLIDVLANGPSTAAQKHLEDQGRQSKFSPNDRLLEMPHIFKVINAEYEAESDKFRKAILPMPVFGGDYALFPNPFYEKNQPSRLVEDIYRSIARPSDLESHFFPKAIGIDNLETGWHFAGRVDATRKILEWIKHTSPTASGSLYVLAADSGTGKSALLGRLIALTDKDYRNKAAEQGWDEKADRNVGTVPNIDQIDAALNLRNLTAQSTADYLADILKIPKTDTIENFVKAAREAYAKTAGSAPCIVLDALDEAEDPNAVVNRVIRPLATGGWKVLVATRPSAQARGAVDLLAALGDGTYYRLDHDAHSRDDIYHYAYGRLKQDKARAAVADQAAKMIAERAENKFLFARMSTSSLLRSGAVITPDMLDSFIAQNATAALEKDVAELDTAFQQKFDRGDLGATSMLTALACAQGEGVPIRDGIWAAMAAAVIRTGGVVAKFEEIHILWLLREAGRFIQEAGDGEQAVYRLFHKSLIEHFLEQRTPEQKSTRTQEEQLAQALVERLRASTDWRYTNPYLIRHMPAHLAARPLQKGLNNLLMNFDWVQERLNQSGIRALLNDYQYCDNAYPAVARLHRTLSMVSHILREHPEQFIPQMLGRIAPGVPDLRPLLDGQPGANFGLPPPNREGLGETLKLMLQTPQLDIEQAGPNLIDHTARLDGFLERARAKIEGEMWVPQLGGLAQAGALIRVLNHQDTVMSVAVSPDGKTIISGSGDNTVRVWDALTEAVPRTLQGHSGTVMSVAVSPDGKTIVSGSDDKTVRVWDALTGTALLTLQGHRDSVWSVAVSPDGKTIVSGDWGTSVWVWDALSGAAILTLEGHSGIVTSVAVSPDGKTIVSGSDDKTVRVWDAVTGVALLTLQGHRLSVRSVAVSPDGKTIISGSADGTVRVWDALTGAALLTLQGHQNSVNCVAVNPDGKAIISGSADDTVRVWDALTGAALLTLQGHRYTVVSVAVSPDGKTIVSGDWGTSVWVWDALSGAAILTLEGHSGIVTSVAVSPDGKTIVSGSDDKTVRVWDAVTGAALERLDLDSSVSSVALGNVDGSPFVAVACSQSIIRLFRLNGRQPIE
jgi:WD40 repeat protein